MTASTILYIGQSEQLIIAEHSPPPQDFHSAVAWPRKAKFCPGQFSSLSALSLEKNNISFVLQVTVARALALAQTVQFTQRT